MRRRAVAGLTILTALATAGSWSSSAPQEMVQGVDVVGTTFRITLADGRVVAQDELPAFASRSATVPEAGG